MKWIVDLLLKGTLQGETGRYLQELARAPISASRRNASELLAKLRAVPGPKIALGETLWGETVEAPLEEIVKACGLITGGMGSGKSMFGLGIIESLIDLLPETRTIGFGILDAKGDLFHGALYL